MENCKFSSEYFDFEKKEKSQYLCNEKPLENGLCIFHDKENKNDEEKIKLLNEKASSASRNNEPLVCIGFILPNIKLDLSFSKPVYFTKAVLGDVDFSGAKFKEVDFGGAEIKGVTKLTDTTLITADFIKTKFFGIADFDRLRCEGNVNFSGAEFHSKLKLNKSFLVGPIFIGTQLQELECGLSKIESGDFHGATIGKSAIFIGAEMDKTTFTQTEFSGEVDFTGCKLNRSTFTKIQFQSIDFSESTLNIVEFNSIKVQKNANFERASLSKVTFIKTNFQKNVIFVETEFKEVEFFKTRFSKFVNFTNSKFETTASFKEVEFEDANFERAQFLGESYFHFTKFNGMVDFKETEFGKTDFTYSKFNHANFISTKFNGETKFHNVFFEKQKQVIFDVDDLSKVSFLGTDISSIRFGENIRWGGSDGFTLIDEKDFIQSPENHSLESLLASYRNLRENYEGRFHYEDANRIMAKEIKLKKEFGKPDKSISDSEILSSKVQELTLDLKRLEEKVKKLEDNLNKKFQ